MEWCSQVSDDSKYRNVSADALFGLQHIGRALARSSMPRSAKFGAGIHTVDPHVNGRMSFEKRMQQEAFIPGAHRPSVVSVLLPFAAPAQPPPPPPGDKAGLMALDTRLDVKLNNLAAQDSHQSPRQLYFVSAFGRQWQPPPASTNVRGYPVTNVPTAAELSPRVRYGIGAANSPRYRTHFKIGGEYQGATALKVGTRYSWLPQSVAWRNEERYESYAAQVREQAP